MNELSTAVYVGTVESNQMDNDGCIGIRISALGGTFLARIVTQMAGDERGVVFLPEKKDQVLVASVIGSDVKWAVIGSLWSRNEKPPVPNSDGKNDTKMIKTRGGNVIELVDKDGEQSIKLTSNGSISLSAKTISINATDGDVRINGGPTVKIN